MSKRNFRQMLEDRWSNGHFVCVGLDSEFDKIPSHLKQIPDSPGDGYVTTTVRFNREIVEATKDLVCAYKPNTAFYEARGAEGVTALRHTIADIYAIAPNVPVILDAKRADIGNTNEGYAKFAFDYLQADAITVHPYLGREALEPFLARADKGVIVLCRTSNPGAGEFQDLDVRRQDHLSHLHPEDDKWERFYHFVAKSVANDWNKGGNCALVIGATYPYELRQVRELVGDLPILIPGVGFQQKDVPLETQVQQVVLSGQDSRGKGMIVNSSRGIIFASKGEDFAQVARQETKKLRDLINQHRSPQCSLCDYRMVQYNVLHYQCPNCSTVKWA